MPDTSLSLDAYGRERAAQASPQHLGRPKVIEPAIARLGVMDEVHEKFRDLAFPTGWIVTWLNGRGVRCSLQSLAKIRHEYLEGLDAQEPN